MVALLIREGTDRTPALDRRLAVVLASVAGALNAAGFRTVGVFSANMTGNASLAAGRAALGEAASSLFYLAIVAVFALGAMTSSFSIEVGAQRGTRAVHALAIACEAIGLALLGVAELRLSQDARQLALVFGLSFLLGFQNAVATRISGSRVRTTHVSGTATDVGIGIGSLLAFALRRGAGNESATIREGVRLHGTTIVAFCGGGVVGAFVGAIWEPGLLFGTSAALLALSLPFAIRRR